MELYNKEIRYMIKLLESRGSFPKFPRELKAYLYDSYLYGNWPCGYDHGDLYSHISSDARAYFNGKLDVTVRPPMERAMDEIQDLREMYGKTMAEKNDLEDYIDELHELLWSHGLEGSRMLHDASGEHKGTYAEFNSFHPEDLE